LVTEAPEIPSVNCKSAELAVRFSRNATDCAFRVKQKRPPAEASLFHFGGCNPGDVSHSDK
jgi:hypothetical protein